MYGLGDENRKPRIASRHIDLLSRLILAIWLSACSVRLTFLILTVSRIIGDFYPIANTMHVSEVRLPCHEAEAGPLEFLCESRPPHHHHYPLCVSSYSSSV